MTSYVYNPTKKVTELLSRYLEFDSEQLQLGIWSGHLSLQDVGLREEAIYPLLNAHIGAQQRAAATADDFEQPPLRFKLVSGSIGSLRVKIPWKQLVWGQGDVRVHLRNVVIVVALESHEETETRRERQDRQAGRRGEGGGDDSDDDDAAAAAAAVAAARRKPLFPPPEKRKGSGSSPNGGREKGEEDPTSLASSAGGKSSKFREKKQKRLREAERRQLQGLPIASWLAAVKKKDDAEKAAAAVADTTTTLKSESRLDKWLNSATKDFFWRFYAGLQAELENVKLVIVQDGIEIGLMMPSIQVVAGGKNNKKGSRNHNENASEAGTSSNNTSSDSSAFFGGQDDPHQHMSMNYQTGQVAPQCDEDEEDGEHIEKLIRNLGLGIYVRKQARHANSNKQQQQQQQQQQQEVSFPADVSTNDYLMRPVDYDFSFSLFYPHPPDKQKKRRRKSMERKQLQQQQPHRTPPPSPRVGGGQHSVSGSSATAGSSSTAKRRRGKRDRQPVGSVSGTDTTAEASEWSDHVPLSQWTPNPAAAAATGAAPLFGRRAAPPLCSVDELSPRTVSSAPKHRRLRSSPVVGFDTQRPQVHSHPHHPNHHPPPPLYPCPPTPSANVSPSQSSFLLPGPPPTGVNRSSSISSVRSLRRGGGRSAYAETAPLARPGYGSGNSVVNAAATSTTLSPEQRVLTARFDGKLSIGAVQIVCSTRHYELVNAFLAAAAKLRRGRPYRTIRSILDQGTAARRSLTVFANASQMAANDDGKAVATPTVARNLLASSIRSSQKSGGGSGTDDHPLEKFLHLRLELHSARSERSEVVRSWWRYIVAVIVWELRQRKRLRRRFQEKYLSFNWERQRYRRSEYVDLYISSKLSGASKYFGLRGGAVSAAALGEESPEEQLLLIEDELPIEQILLYRALARDVCVRGGTRMPDSILELATGGGGAPPRPKPLSSESHQVAAADASAPKAGSRRASFNSQHNHHHHIPKDVGSTSAAGDNPTILSIVEERCETARDRRDGRDGDALQDYERQIPWSMLRSGGGGGPSWDVDAASYGMSSQADMTIKSFKTAKSRHHHHAAVAGGADCSNPVVRGLMIHFSLALEKLEFMVVEEECYMDGYADPYNRGNAPDDSEGTAGRSFQSGDGSSSMAESDVSGLTEDDRFFAADDQDLSGHLDHIAINYNANAHEVPDDFILASTDYLLFKMPEKIILCCTVARTTCSLQACKGGSRTAHCRIGAVVCTGDLGCRLLSVGRAPPPQVANSANEHPVAPITEVSTGRDGKISRGGGDGDGDGDGDGNSARGAHCGSGAGEGGLEQQEILGSSSYHQRTTSTMASTAAATGTGTSSSSGCRFGTEAAVLSIVVQEGATLLQCDAAQLKCRLDLPTAEKLLGFGRHTTAQFPRPVLPKSPREDVRLYVLRQNAASSYSALNCSVRVRGCELLLPAPEGGGDDPLVVPHNRDELSFGMGASGRGDNCEHVREAGALLRIGLIEAYSGTEVEAMSMAPMNDWHQQPAEEHSYHNEVPAIAAGRGTATRALRMLDVGELVMGNSSVFSHHFVFAMTGLDCVVNSTMLDGEVISEGPSLLESPIDIEMLLTGNSNSVSDSNRARYELVVEVSPVHMIASESRVIGISQVLPSLIPQQRQQHRQQHHPAGSPRPPASPSNGNSGSSPLPPRLEMLSRFLVYTLDLNVGRVRLSFIADEERVDGLSAEAKQEEMEQSLADFLSVVSSFDLSFPHEEALSSAMQICIDRLTGLGLVLEESWEATNTALLNFLEDIAEMRRAQSEDSKWMSPDEDSPPPPKQQQDSVDNMMGAEPHSEQEELVRNTLWQSVERTVALYSYRLRSDDPIYRHQQHMTGMMMDEEEDAMEHDDLAFDFPDGVNASIVKCFYDTHLSGTFPTMFVTNAAGVHILNVTPKDSGTPGGSEDGDDAEDVRSDKIESDKSSRYSSNVAVGFCSFEVDREQPFGRGGLPLSVLGSDGDADEDEKRTREHLKDVVFSDVEVLFSQQIMDDVLKVVAAVLDPLNDVPLSGSVQSMGQADGSGNDENKEEEDGVRVAREATRTGMIPSGCSYLLLSGETTSILFASDDLFPFSRLIVKDMVLRRRSESCDDCDDNETSSAEDGGSEVSSVSASALSMLNLTPEGEIYPTALMHLPESHDLPVLIRYSTSRKTPGESRMEIELRGFQVFFLQQFLNECLQYFVSGKYGVGLFMKNLRRLQQQAEEDGPNEGKKTKKKGSFGYKMSLYNSSIILPRSSASSDMVAVEVASFLVSSERPAESFVLPTATSPLVVPGMNARSSESDFQETYDGHHHVMQDEEDEDEDGHDLDRKSISRIKVQLKGCQILTSLSESPQDHPALESPSFRFFYAIDGRAIANSPVYRRNTAHDGRVAEDQHAFMGDEKTRRCWREITSIPVSLDVLVDYAPYRRVLIADPLGRDDVLASPSLPSSPKKKTMTNALDLDMAQAQFCLLLSVYFSNMQELPVMFPYSAEELERNARPKTDPNLPEQGTSQYCDRLKDTSDTTSEFALVLNHLRLRCTQGLDGSRGLGHPSSEFAGIRVHFEKSTVHYIGDCHGISRIGVASHSVSLIDESKTFQRALALEGAPSPSMSSRINHSWADLKFGLDETSRSMRQNLPQKFLLTIFMTQSGTVYNLGMDSPHITVSDLSTVFNLLKFISSYFTDPASGNPSFEAADRASKMKAALRKSLDGVDVPETPPGTSTDFRLFLIRPRLCIPCDETNKSAPGLRLETEKGLWYRYCSIDDYASQEVVSEGLTLIYDDECVDLQSMPGDDSMQRYLVEGLSLGLRLGFNGSANHSDYSLQIPFVNPKACSMTSQRISVLPDELPAPTICLPFESSERLLGPNVCEITCIIEVLPSVSSALLHLFSSDSGEPEQDDANRRDVFDDQEGGAKNHHQDPDEGSLSLSRIRNEEEEESSGGSLQSKTAEDPSSNSTFSFVAKVGDLRIFALDPVLGPHLPVAVLSISSVALTASQFANAKQVCRVARGDSAPEDLQLLVEGLFWADYFKLGMTRSWEPLLEAYRFTVLYEKSTFRGSGLSLQSDTPLHINISGALLLILDEVIDLFHRLIRDTFGSDSSAGDKKTFDSRAVAVKDRLIVQDAIEDTALLHEMPKPLDSGDRVAFSLRNMTGQKIRVYRIEDEMPSKSAVVTYLGHTHSTKLFFLPSISTVRNMSVIEVSYPGLPNSPVMAQGHQKLGSVHEVDAQLPGFRWLQGIKVDTFGRTFESIVPRAKEVFRKTTEDWRLCNTMRIVAEVGLENGGRQVTLRSLFSVVNNTTHTLSLLLNPDPTFEPEKKVQKRGSGSVRFGHPGAVPDAHLEPGDMYQVPTLLLESALRQVGSHLGSIWIRPEVESTHAPAMESFFSQDNVVDNSELGVDFSSRPVQLAKLVSESALMFESGNGCDITPDAAKSGVQLSCPVIQDNGDRLAPFCYAVEVGRSPLVKARLGSESEKESGRHIHGPVAYTLSIHPPFVIVNLLPERGRFELMHAVRKTVLWFGDLDAGEQISVHSVGLDAPLLLLLNLGFCRTPVGEGALVHHGSDPPHGTRENLSGLKSIGKAGKAVTKQVGKALTSIGDSPDRRGVNKVYQAATQQQQTNANRRRVVRKNAKTDLGMDTGLSGIDKVDGKTYKIDMAMFFPGDVAAETTVVDSVGQRLTLNIENFRGGGGQRRISVFCPFWIVNTTEHALRYRQDNSKNCVSGTVLSPARDGSLPLSGGRARAKYAVPDQQLTKSERLRRPLNEGTVFSGTPGALATSPGRCELSPERLAPLIDKNIPLEKLAKLAFMFNFHEGVLIGHQKLCVQLGDGTGSTPYESDWSRGFSLDSVGFSQVVGMHCKDGRALELSVVVNVAPGFLSGYTKTVRFLPRFVVYNSLSYPIRIWQDSSVFRPATADQVSGSGGISSKDRKWRIFGEKSKKEARKVNQYEALWGRETRLDERTVDNIAPSTTAHRSALYITSLSHSELIPFNLPDSRGDRELRIDLGGQWNLSASFSADVPGEHTLKVTRAVDLRMIRHVATRASAQYEVRLPPRSGGPVQLELGVWFETEWGSDRSLIVKAVKTNSFAFNQTDIHVGDELLLIDGVPVSRMTFVEAMTKLRNRLSELAIRSQSEGPPSRRKIRRASLNMRLTARAKSSFSSDEATTDLHPLTLTFRTVEERLRRVRQKAARADEAQVAGDLDVESMDQSQDKSGPSFHYLKAELRTIHHSLFLVLRDTDAEKSPVPYQIQNQSINSVIYFRQRGCNGHPWLSLKPGQSDSYSWEEPMKPRRLMVRVATQRAFLSEETVQPENVIDETLALLEQRNKRFGFLKVNDEEDGTFTTSISVRLEEIGFQEFLPCPATSGGAIAGVLELEVDVVGATRVLVVHDASVDDGDEQQMARHLKSLDKKCLEEETRQIDLQTLKMRLDPDCVTGEPPDENLKDGLVEGARALMLDFPEESTITRQHQLVVEVMEATGLSPENFVGTCNPYVEVYLKSGSTRKKSLFAKKDLRRTYYVKKSLNPTWNSQSFIFDVPKEAAEIPRGHSVRLRVRNFRIMADDQILGKAQVDLHSVRNQAPLVGWFPLAGRTGRRELESPLSQWGRGSVKLRVQWIYEIPALLDYFILLSQSRLKELRESVEGMTKQLEEKKEAEKKKMEGMDGFKAVRVRDLLTLSRTTNERKFQPPAILSRDDRDTNKKIPSSQRVRRKMRAQKPAMSRRLWDDPSPKERPPSRRLERAESKRRSLVSSRQLSPGGFGMDNLENRISQQRQNVEISSLSLGAKRSTLIRSSILLQPNYSGTFAVSSFKSLVAAQALFKDTDLDVVVHQDEIEIKVRPHKPSQDAVVSHGRESERLVTKKLALPSSSPSTVTVSAKDYAAAFSRSRLSFERASRRALRAVLNPGGWLTIRPITALNLPDTYTGMYVKLRYGSEILVSESADARVSPTWYKRPPQSFDASDLESSVRPSEAKAESLDFSPNDLHVHVAPQKTSGSIQISVVGEKSQQLHAKAELGVLHLPLGRAIATCIDGIDEYMEANPSSTTTPMYVRWFPLMDPKDAVPVEGDGGLSLRPSETEKVSDNLFHEYFAPCIQLALIWWPDQEEEGIAGEEEDVNTTLQRGQRGVTTEQLPYASSGANPSPTVESYFNADVGRISAALIDSQRSFELLSFAAMDIGVRYWVTKAKTRMGVAIGWLQLDHQDDHAREPVIFAPTPTDNLVPVIQILAVKDNVRSKTDVLSFHFIDVSIEEFDLTVEESFLFDLFDFLTSIDLRRASKKEAAEGSKTRIDSNKQAESTTLIATGEEPEEPSLLKLLEIERQASGEQKIYIEQLFLGVVKVNLSYLKGKKQSWEGSDEVTEHIALAGGEKLVRTFTRQHEKSDVFLGWSQHTYDEDRWAEGRGKESQNLSTMIASLFPNVSDAPVRLQGKALNHVFESPTEIFQSIKKYYREETLKQIYKIIGSLDFVGNPTMLLTSFIQGARDLVMTPSVAFMKSPTDISRVGIGVGKGALSLFSHSASGFFGFFAKVSAAAGHGVAFLSLDSDYRVWHRDKIVTEATNLNREWKRRGVQSTGAIILRPLGDIFLGVGHGVAGLVLSPIKGYQRKGNIGLIQGLGIGCVGVVAKPVVGVFDSIAHFSASMHDIAKSVNVLEKRYQPALKLRLPYTFAIMNILTPFDSASARAVYLLKVFPPKRPRHASSHGETLVHVEVLPNIGSDTYAIVTSVRMILIKVKKETNGELTPSLCWEVGLTGEALVSSRVAEHGHNGVALTITLTKLRESDDSTHALVSSDTDAGTAADRTMGLASPDMQFSNMGLDSVTLENTGDGEEFNHGTGRGNEGELLEWFTVLAEYQYRRQLCRLNNAISCLVRDFGAIMHDPSLGHKGSTQGYSSFGIFFFEKESATEKPSEPVQLQFPPSLELLPWISEASFIANKKKSAEEQKEYLSMQRVNWDLSGELEASSREGGPEWLVMARARAVLVDDEDTLSQVESPDGAMMNPSQNVAEAGVTDEDVFMSAVTDLVSPIFESTREEESDLDGSIDTMEEVGTHKIRTSNETLDSGSACIRVGFKDTAEAIESSYLSAESTDGSVSKNRQSSSSACSHDSSLQAKISDDGALEASQMSALHGSNEDVASLQQDQVDMSNSPGSMEMASSEAKASEHGATSRTPVFHSTPLEQSNIASTPHECSQMALSEMTASTPVPLPSRPDHANTSAPPGWTETHTSGAMSSAQVHGQNWTSGYEVRTTYMQHHPTPSQERLDRMEALMERLVTYSAEQALASRAPPSQPEVTNETAILKDEIAELRVKVDNSTDSSQVNQQISALRGDIAALRDQISAQTPRTQKTEDTIEAID